ncbi:hypothetical protein [Sphingomonas immobilis]|uniref:Uncharacterized protein n=1 Tax=Sphingomonas immobilis TaxID=3063997 RepID=A0ABT9A0J6_9SPHN|nr:hypothetical protein [Sphingomonas sp. CA1-15]MDO7843358.1 hypothetical protein [Sphingomonas sp. CA1-15]
MPATSNCKSFACNTVVEGQVKTCPTCGKKMMSSRTIRILGGTSLACGVFLLGLMGTVTIALLPMLMHPNTGGSSGFTGTPEQARTALYLFAAVMTFGLFATLSGALQVITGRRSRIAIIATFVLAIALFVYVRYATQAFS